MIARKQSIIEVNNDDDDGDNDTERHSCAQIMPSRKRPRKQEKVLKMIPIVSG